VFPLRVLGDSSFLVPDPFPRLEDSCFHRMSRCLGPPCFVTCPLLSGSFVQLMAPMWLFFFFFFFFFCFSGHFPSVGGGFDFGVPLPYFLGIRPGPLGRYLFRLSPLPMFLGTPESFSVNFFFLSTCCGRSAVPSFSYFVSPVDPCLLAFRLAHQCFFYALPSISSCCFGWLTVFFFVDFCPVFLKNSTYFRCPAPGRFRFDPILTVSTGNGFVFGQAPPPSLFSTCPPLVSRVLWETAYRPPPQNRTGFRFFF